MQPIADCGLSIATLARDHRIVFFFFLAFQFLSFLIFLRSPLQIFLLPLSLSQQPVVVVVVAAVVLTVLAVSVFAA